MTRVSKTLEVTDGELYTIQGDRRFPASKCNAKIEIREHLINVPILGKGRVVDEREVVLLVTFDHEPMIRDIFSVDSFQFQGNILRNDGIVEKVTLNNCMLVDDLDLTDAGTCTFEVRCSQNIVKKLNMM